MKFLILIWLLSASSIVMADGVVKVDPTTIGITKTNNLKAADAQKEMANLVLQLNNLQKEADAIASQRFIVNTRIDEILQQFQSVGIDLVDQRG